MNPLHLIWIIPASAGIGIIIGYIMCAVMVIRPDMKEWEEHHNV